MASTVTGQSCHHVVQLAVKVWKHGHGNATIPLEVMGETVANRGRHWKLERVERDLVQVCVLPILQNTLLRETYAP